LRPSFHHIALPTLAWPIRRERLLPSTSSDDVPVPKAKAKAKAVAKKVVEDSEDDSSDDGPAPKAQAKVARAKAKAPAKVDDSEDDDSDDEPAPKAKAKTKPVAKKMDDSEDDDDRDELVPKAKAKVKAKAKAAAKADDSDDDDSDDEPAPKAKAKAKAVAKKPEEDDDDDGSDDEPAPKAKAKAKAKADEDNDVDDDVPASKSAAQSTDELTVFVGGLSFTCTEDQVRKDFGDCGEISKFHMPLNDEGKPRGIAFITYETKDGVSAAMKFDGDDYAGRTLKVNLAGQKPEKGKGDKGKGKGDKGKGKENKGGGKGDKGNDELTVFVRGLPWSTDEETLKKDFGECGEIERLSLPLNEEGQPKGIAFVQYKEEKGVEEALKFDDTDYGGRTINVRKAGDRGEKGDGKGKDGKGYKGKGKDKGKGKGKKGKGKDDMSFAKKDGAMVESTGKKQTFADSDEDEADAPPKKKTKTVQAKEDSEDE